IRCAGVTDREPCRGMILREGRALPLQSPPDRIRVASFGQGTRMTDLTHDAPPAGRIATLDIVRGIAVMGILAMNIIAFAMPAQAYFTPFAYGGSASDVATWAFNFVFVDGKMRGFFSFLFGASMLLVIERTDAAGGSGLEAHVRRMVWLLLFGLAHLYL